MKTFQNHLEMPVLKKTLIWLNIPLSLVLTLSLVYAFLFRYILPLARVKIFKKPKGDNIRETFSHEFVSLSYLIFFSACNFISDVFQNQTMLKYLPFLRHVMLRGLFHIWIAVSTWKLLSYSLPHQESFSPQHVSNCVSWTYLCFGIIEIFSSFVIEDEKGQTADFNNFVFPNIDDICHGKQFEIRFSKPVLRTFVERFLNFYSGEEKAGSAEFDAGNLEEFDEGCSGGSPEKLEKISESKNSLVEETPVNPEVSDQGVVLDNIAAIFTIAEDILIEKSDVNDKLEPVEILKISTADIKTPDFPQPEILFTQTQNFDQEKHDFYLSVIASTQIDRIIEKL
jgi:hypothetical protein